jgi:leucine dehydrogenase
MIDFRNIPASESRKPSFKESGSPVWSRPTFREHDLVVHHHDPVTGLRAIVAIHAPREARACGGCRMRPYASEEHALDDVLRLSEAMSYKAAMADVACGGAKAVIIGDPRADKTEELLRAMGRLIERFRGAYISAPDVGIGFDDLKVFRQESEWVVGADDIVGPSAPYTALGVFEGLRAATRFALGRDELEGLRVGLQGLGSVGRELARRLDTAGARLVVADIDAAAVEAVVERHHAEAVGFDEILFADVDVLSPNALGGVLNDDTIPRLRAKVVCGAANNQLAAPSHGDALHARGILYAPDYVVSAGGLIAGMEEVAGFDPRVANQKVRRVGQTLTEVLEVAESEGIPHSAAADRLARDRIARWRLAAA